MYKYKKEGWKFTCINIIMLDLLLLHIVGERYIEPLMDSCSGIKRMR